jgi:Arc/MetJ-type ribon-helix-helix transcriptional regulator
MSYQFPSDRDEEMRRRMATGQYSSEDDVLRDALSALRWRDEEVAAIREGIEDMEAGRVQTLRKFDREFRERKNIPQDV